MKPQFPELLVALVLLAFGAEVSAAGTATPPGATEQNNADQNKPNAD